MVGVVVAICWARGARKDTLADALCREAGFTNHKFARPLKDTLASLFGLSHAHVEGELKDEVHPEWGVTPRTLLQWFGTDVMQHGLSKLAPHVGRRFWSDRLRQELLACPEGARVVISDLRFPHELAMLRSTFSDRLVTVRVDRRASSSSCAATRKNPRSDDPADDHESETGVAGLEVDVELRNDGSEDKLRRLATGVLCPGDLYLARRPAAAFPQPQVANNSNLLISSAPTLSGVARLISVRGGRVRFVPVGTPQPQSAQSPHRFCQHPQREGGDEERTCSVEAWLLDWERAH